MNRHPFGPRTRRVAGGGALLAALLLTGACDLTTGPDDQPTRAEITIEGTSPNPLKLITSLDFVETFNRTTLQYGAVLNKSDTVEITLPYSGTVQIGDLGSVYVELFQPQVPTASVRMRVNLDNGESYDQNATLSDKASLIYYFAYFVS